MSRVPVAARAFAPAAVLSRAACAGKPERVWVGVRLGVSEGVRVSVGVTLGVCVKVLVPVGVGVGEQIFLIADKATPRWGIAGAQVAPLFIDAHSPDTEATPAAGGDETSQFTLPEAERTRE